MVIALRASGGEMKRLRHLLRLAVLERQLAVGDVRDHAREFVVVPCCWRIETVMVGAEMNRQWNHDKEQR